MQLFAPKFSDILRYLLCHAGYDKQYYSSIFRSSFVSLRWPVRPSPNTVPTLIAADNCSIATVVFDEQRVDGSCANNYELFRTWTATDACGNETSYTQIIDVQDTTGPVFVETLPEDTYANCDGIPVAPTLTAIDNCGAATVTYTETEVEGDCSNRYSLIRKWTATESMIKLNKAIRLKRWKVSRLNNSL
jgi:hypothetical protein